MARLPNINHIDSFAVSVHAGEKLTHAAQQTPAHMQKDVYY